MVARCPSPEKSYREIHMLGAVIEPLPGYFSLLVKKRGELSKKETNPGKALNWGSWTWNINYLSTN